MYLFSVFIAETMYLIHEHCWLKNNLSSIQLNSGAPESASDISELMFLTPWPTLVPHKNRKGKFKTWKERNWGKKLYVLGYICVVGQNKALERTIKKKMPYQKLFHNYPWLKRSHPDGTPAQTILGNNGVLLSERYFYVEGRNCEEVLIFSYNM